MKIFILIIGSLVLIGFLLMALSIIAEAIGFDWWESLADIAIAIILFILVIACVLAVTFILSYMWSAL